MKLATFQLTLRRNLNTCSRASLLLDEGDVGITYVDLIRLTTDFMQ